MQMDVWYTVAIQEMVDAHPPIEQLLEEAEAAATLDMAEEESED